MRARRFDGAGGVPRTVFFFSRLSEHCSCIATPEVAPWTMDLRDTFICNKSIAFTVLLCFPLVRSSYICVLLFVSSSPSSNVLGGKVSAR